MIVTLDINGFFFDNIPPYLFLMISSWKMCHKQAITNDTMMNSRKQKQSAACTCWFTTDGVRSTKKLSFEKCYVSLSLHIMEIFPSFFLMGKQLESQWVQICVKRVTKTRIFFPALSRLPFLILFGYVTEKEIIPRFTRHKQMWHVTMVACRPQKHQVIIILYSYDMKFVDLESLCLERL